jgi:hypothetical protein
MEEERLICERCKKHLEQGANVTLMEKAIINQGGVVQLGSASIFCSDRCLKNYPLSFDLPELSPRAPKYF